MDYFWKQQDDIPQGMGYPLFGKAHLFSVAITLVLMIVLLSAITRFEDSKRRKIQKIIPVVMVIMEIFKDMFLVSVHRFGIGYFPLHICSIGIFVFLLREYLPWKYAKSVLGEIAFIIIMPASMAALLFADWTIYYPVCNFMNIYSYAWHGLLLLYPMLIKISNEISPSVKHIHYNLIFLILLVPPVYIFDKKYGCNYFFLNWPVPGSPLVWLESVMGNPGYLIGYAVLTILIILFVYFLIWVTEKLEQKRSNECA